MSTQQTERQANLDYLKARLTPEKYAQVEALPDAILVMLIESEIKAEEATKRAETAEEKAKRAERAENEEISKISHLFESVELDPKFSKSGLIKRAIETAFIIDLARTATTTTARQTAINTAIASHAKATADRLTAEKAEAEATTEKEKAKAVKAYEKAEADRLTAESDRQTAEALSTTEDEAKAQALAHFEKAICKLYWIETVAKSDGKKLSPAQSANAIFDCLQIVKANNISPTLLNTADELIAKLTAQRKTLSEESATHKKALATLAKAEKAHKSAPTADTQKALDTAKSALADAKKALESAEQADQSENKA